MCVVVGHPEEAYPHHCPVKTSEAVLTDGKAGAWADTWAGAAEQELPR